jgi:phosphopantetheinyl transferase
MLWWLALPAASRRQHKQQLHFWLQDFLPQQLGGPVELSFHAGQAPQLRQAGQPLPLSLAYAGQAALVAVSRQAVGIGVDLLWQNDVGDDAAQVAAEFFPASIANHLAQLPELQRRQLFGQQWARLEAALKAAQLPLAEAQRLTPAQWQRAVPLQGLPPGYAAALALSNP